MLCKTSFWVSFPSSWKKVYTRSVYFSILLVGMDIPSGSSILDNFGDARDRRSIGGHGLPLSATALQNPVLLKEKSNPPSLQDPVNSRPSVSPVGFLAPTSSVSPHLSQRSNHLIHAEPTELSSAQPLSFDVSPWRFGQEVSSAKVLSECFNPRLTENPEPACDSSVYEAHQL